MRNVKLQTKGSTQRGVFVTGTDTGVGKTLVASALVLCLKQWGINVGVMKPIETGVSPSPKAQSDGARLRKAAGCLDPMTEVSPYRFRLPLAPLSASQAEGRTLRMATIIRTFRGLHQRYALMVVEGAGGINVPITWTLNMLDLIQEMNLSVIVVGQSGLGGINHALLTLHALRQRKIPVMALILNQQRPLRTKFDRLQEQSTVTLLGRLAEAPVVGPILYRQSLNRHWDEELARFSETTAITRLAKMVLASGKETLSPHGGYHEP